MKVENGHKVKVSYKGTLDDGSVFDSSEGKDPLEFIAGSGQVIKGFDDAVIGMDVGDEKKVEIKPEDAYGPRVEEMAQEVPVSAFGENKPEVGTTIGLKAPTGQVIPAKIMEVNGDKVKLDMNHPLAGQKLNFEIKVVDAKELTKEEKEELEKQKDAMHSCASGCGDGCNSC